MTARLAGIVVIGLLLAAPGAATAQEATLSGTITDSTGGVLPGVTVTALHEASGNTFVAVTDERGGYRLALRTGLYRIEAALQGFATLNRSGLELLVGQQAVANLQLAPSSLQESVTVTGEAPLLETTQSSLGTNIDPRQMQDLPINGRNWMDLTLMASGSRANAAGASPGVTSGMYQINVDGQEVTQKMTAGFGQPLYSRDAIGEFEIRTNRFDAAQGRSTGIQINAITKSGTNAFAGTFSGYFRNDRFNAADHVVGEVLPYSNQQWSGTVGGPIRRDRIHFFANYEYEREPNTVAFTTPYESFNVQLTGANTKHLAGARVDLQFSTALRLAIRGQKSSDTIPYNATNTATSHPSAIPSTTRDADNFLVSFTQVLGNRAVNEVRASYAYYVIANTPIVNWPNHPQSRLWGITTGAPNIQLTGFNVGNGLTHPQRHPAPEYNVRDDFTVSLDARGRHTIRMGGEYMRVLWTQNLCRICQGQLDARGGAVPANIEAILPVWNDVDSWNLAALSSITRRYTIGVATPADGVGAWEAKPRRHYLAGYIQDDWTLGARVTVNLGVRYDYITGAFAEDVELLPFFEAGRPRDKNNVGPRTGFAWSLDDQTVIRGGWGLFFGDIRRSESGTAGAAIHQLQVEAVNDGRADFAANPFNGPIPTYEQALPRMCSTNNVPGCLRRDLSGDTMTFRDSQFPYAHQASLGLQRQLGRSLAVEADYTFSGGRREEYTRNQNLSYNRATGVNYLSSDISRRPFPEWGQVNTIFRDGWSNYHGLQTSVTKRFSGRWQASGNYLLSWTRNGTPLPISGFERITFPVTPDLGGEYGLAVGDQRHRAVANGIVEVGYGFQVSGLYFFGSGERFATSWGGDLRNVGVSGENRLRPDSTIVPRNNFVGEPIHRVDMRLQRRFPLGGRAGIDGIVEVFNLFNRANYGAYTTQESSANYGKPAQNTNLAYAPRMLQLGFRLAF
jgi:hypothetical protein